jgi:hypothetical protein
MIDLCGEEPWKPSKLLFRLPIPKMLVTSLMLSSASFEEVHLDKIIERGSDCQMTLCQK